MLSPQYDHGLIHACSFSLGSLKGQGKAKAYQVLLAGEEPMEGNGEEERAHIYMMYLLGPPTFKILANWLTEFIPPFLLSIGGVIQWAWAFQIYFQLH